MECQIRDITFHYEETGTGHPLIVLHGAPGDHRNVYKDLEPIFANRQGWRRIYPDLPGMGETKAPDWITTQDQMLDLVIEFMHAVAPGERFSVVGNSYGGYLALGLVYKTGVSLDGMMAYVPLVETKREKVNLPERRVIHEDPEFLAALTPQEGNAKEIAVAQSMELLASIRKYIQPAIAIADHDFLKRLNANFAFSFDIRALPEPFQGPALFLTGRFDHWVGYREAYLLLDQYPRATFAVLDRAGHALPIEQKVLFRALVNEWLDRVEEYIGEH